MIFKNRRDAGGQLADLLQDYRNRKDVIVLGIPRGGVVVAFEVASLLNAPLDVFVSRKLGVPWHEELAFGAVASGGVKILDAEIVETLGIPDVEIERIITNTRTELERRERAFRGDRPPLKVEGLTVILVDDGLATGSSMRAAIGALRQLKPARIVVAIPVAPVATCNQLRMEVDRLVCVLMPETFLGVGQFYDDFTQVTDEEVIDLLGRTARPVTQPG